MARIDIVMPQMGESITTGTITKWHKKVGDLIALDEILFDISTDKVESEIPSPVEGKVVELLYKEGDTIDVGKLIAVIDDDANAAITASPKKETAQASTKKSIPSEKEEVLAEEETEETVTKAKAPTAKTVQAPVEEEDESADGTKRFYTPLVRKMAQDNGVKLSELEKLTGSGAGGRVNREDFEKYLASRGGSVKSASAEKSTAVSSGAAVSTGATGRVEIIPMDNMRKAIAKNMVQSKLTSPHVNSIGEVDMSHLVKFRESFKNTFEKQEGFKLTYTPFIMRAIIMALKEHPYVNASLDGDNIVLKKDINLGCAVAVPGNGLVVPVIKNADSLSMVGLCRAVNEIALKARAKKLTMNDLTGGTFTFTNVGSFGTLMATPVILQPQVEFLLLVSLKKERS
jgi:pyruvate dehydrogenase E2 component (dihydrolipoamide acetyltransferase)